METYVEFTDEGKSYREGLECRAESSLPSFSLQVLASPSWKDMRPYLT